MTGSNDDVMAKIWAQAMVGEARCVSIEGKELYRRQQNWLADAEIRREENETLNAQRARDRWRQEWEEKRAKRDAQAKASGMVLMRPDPGRLRWAGWLKESAEPYVPEMTCDAVPSNYGVLALGWGLELLADLRRQGRRIKDPLQFVLDKAWFYQTKRRIWAKPEDANRMPHLIVRENQSCETEAEDSQYWLASPSLYWAKRQAAADVAAKNYELPEIGACC